MDESFCYVTTKGRVTGNPHEIEIWFVVSDGALFLMAEGGERADWVRNMRADSAVKVRLAQTEFDAVAHPAPTDVDEDSIRRAMAAKYQGWEEGAELSDWAKTALLVRLTPAQGHLTLFLLAKTKKVC
ncbi:MAG TPA: nitroreductase family deazaflavin-dependent oxidoreductase [Actinomycetota bacterium]|nr:nitroreductase family deazaflavin-dependent oxidoreductase [Actinomycetota bacterium]